VSSHKSQAQHRLRREHLARSIHQLGARALFELLDEIAREHGLGDDFDRRLERYAAVDFDLLRATGGDRFAASPMRTVGGAR
jgi:hypothetical protein